MLFNFFHYIYLNIQAYSIFALYLYKLIQYLYFEWSSYTEINRKTFFQQHILTTHRYYQHYDMNFGLLHWWSQEMRYALNRFSVQFSRSVMSHSLWPHESQHARPPCPSPSPGVHQIHIHRVSDAIQPSHPMSSPFPPAPNPSQHQSLFQWVNSSHEVAKVLEFQL